MAISMVFVVGVVEKLLKNIIVEIHETSISLNSIGNRVLFLLIGRESIEQ